MAKKSCRQAGRRWEKTQKRHDRLLYKKACVAKSVLCEQAKRSYYNQIVGEAKTSKEIFGIINGLLHRTKESLTRKAYLIRSYRLFRQKIQRIKACRLDPVPTWVVKGCAGILSPVITTIVESLQCGTVPIVLKESIVTPIIKRDNLEREDLHNYRPVSDIPFVAICYLKG